jgi:dihydrodipicolinate synthase/N-acetylneuraminate lyase
MNSFSGLYIPATTPFDSVTGEIAPVHFRNNLRRWLEEPIDGYVLFGSTGEGVLVDDDEKAKLIQYARELIRPDSSSLSALPQTRRAITKRNASRSWARTRF